MKTTQLPPTSPPIAGDWRGDGTERLVADPPTGRGDSKPAKKVLRQAGLFALVGVANTGLDFAVYNALTSGLLGWPRIPANVVSTTVAMTFSFVVNLFWVFSPQRTLVSRRAFRFIGVTACALYGVQNLVIWLASGFWSAPFDHLAAQCVQTFSLGAGHEDLVARNLVKIAATVASMTWNFFWYRLYVYREH